jgi:hypothetical protein
LYQSPLVDRRLFVGISFEVATFNDTLYLSAVWRDEMTLAEVKNYGCRLDVGIRLPALVELQQWHNVDSSLLAQAAGFDDADVVRQIWMGRHGRFTVPIVTRILEVLSELVGVTYTLDNVYVQFCEEWVD